MESLSRYSFQAHHFTLAHDITLDNTDITSEEIDKNFPAIFDPKQIYQNEPTFTSEQQQQHGWSTTSTRSGQSQRPSIDLLASRLQRGGGTGNGLSTTSPSPTSVGFNNLLEARNYRNVAVSKSGGNCDAAVIDKSLSGYGNGGSMRDAAGKKVADCSGPASGGGDVLSPTRRRLAQDKSGTTTTAGGYGGSWRIEDLAMTIDGDNRSTGLNTVRRSTTTANSRQAELSAREASVVCRTDDRKFGSPVKKLSDIRPPLNIQTYCRAQPVESATVAAIAASNGVTDNDLSGVGANRGHADSQRSSNSSCSSSSSPRRSTAAEARGSGRTPRQLPAVPVSQQPLDINCSKPLKARGCGKQTHQIKAMTTSLAEELEAALLGTDEKGNVAAKRLSLTLPLTSHLTAGDNDEVIPCCCGNRMIGGAGIAQFLIDVAQLGTPELVDPINKYRDVVCDIAYGSIYVPGAVEDSSPRDLDSEDGSSGSAGEDSVFGTSDVDVNALSTNSLSLSPTGSLKYTDIDDMTPVGMTGLPNDINEDDDDDVTVKGVSRVVECLPDVIAETVTRTDRQHSDNSTGFDVSSTPCKSKTTCTAGSQGSKKPTGSSLFERTSSIDSSRSSSPARRSLFSDTPTSGSSGSLDYDLTEADATHRGCHRFVPRHPEELAIEISDPIYVELEEDDLWCEGINLRTKERGIFPTAYATDLTMLDDTPRSRKFFLKFVGSIEVAQHKGNDVLCQAINKLVMMRQPAWDTSPPPLCCLEINEYGIKMTERTKKKDSILTSDESTLAKKLARLLAKSIENSSGIDNFFSLKNICFCGYHPKNERYLGIITKHPVAMRFACHVFMGEKSTRTVAEVIGDAFQRFYQEYLAVLNPTEDIYLE